MQYIDPHIHMISRVTDDYHRMAQCGCVAISEPAFWAGFDRGSAEGFRDYFHHLVEVEPKEQPCLVFDISLGFASMPRKQRMFRFRVM